MSVGVISTSYPRWPDDPAGNFVGAHVEALRALGHDVEVICAGPHGDRDRVRGGADPRVTRIASPLFYRGGAPDALERHPARALVDGAWFAARLTAAVARRAHAWSSIVAHWLVPSALAALPARTPLLAIAHGGDVHTLRRLRLLEPVLHVLHARRAELVFVSAELRAIARTAAPSLAPWIDRATIQPMGVRLARFTALEPAPTSPPTLVIASRLVPIKGIDVAIAAMRHVRTPVRLVIAGDGPERATLERAADDRITFLGEVDTVARDQLLRTASAVLVPSRVIATGRSEGTPLIAVEALAAGVPVIASAVGGLRELAAVHRISPEDPVALAAAIDQVLAAPPSASDLRAAVEHLDWRAIAPYLVRNP